MKIIQRTILIIAVGIFSLSELFPPWLYEDNWNSNLRSAGYHFILAPTPEIKSYPEMKVIFSIPDKELFAAPDATPIKHGFSVRKDVARLYGQRFSIMFLMLGFLLVLDDRKKLLKIMLGSILICIGIGFLGLCILPALK